MDQLSFHGAAETVTGSKYLLESDGARVLVDCGLFQGLKELRLRNWDRLPFEPESVASVVLTHAHVDHIGYLPRFVHDGFRGPIYCTPATAELCELQLYDTAKCEAEDARYANKKGYSKHRPALPLFDENDVGRTLKLLRTVKQGEWFARLARFGAGIATWGICWARRWSMSSCGITHNRREFYFRAMWAAMPRPCITTRCRLNRAII